MGLSLWQQDANDSRRYRVARGNASVYIDGREPVVRLALRTRGAGGTETVGLALDGRPAGTTPVREGTWTDLTLQLPDRPGEPRFRRLDLWWTPPSDSATLDVGRPEYPRRVPR